MAWPEEHELGSFMALLKQCVSENEAWLQVNLYINIVALFGT